MLATAWMVVNVNFSWMVRVVVRDVHNFWSDYGYVLEIFDQRF